MFSSLRRTGKNVLKIYTPVLLMPGTNLFSIRCYTDYITPCLNLILSILLSPLSAISVNLRRALLVIFSGHAQNWVNSGQKFFSFFLKLMSVSFPQILRLLFLAGRPPCGALIMPPDCLQYTVWFDDCQKIYTLHVEEKFEATIQDLVVRTFLYSVCGKTQIQYFWKYR